MATAIADDDEEFVTCGVCFHRYDLEEKKPKFLQCLHCLCLSCVKGILREGNLCCPFCRCTFFSLNAESLPNNNYATQILRLMEKSKKTAPETAPGNLASMSWCSECQSAGNSLCAVLGHLTISLTSETVKKMEGMIAERAELLKLKDQGMEKLAQIIQKRRLIEERLSLVMKSIRFAEEEVKKLQDDNNFKLTKAISILDLNKQPVSASTSEMRQEEKDDLFISKLISMIEGCSVDDTTEILKDKMNRTLDIYSENLEEATSTVSRYDILEKTKIAVLLNNNATERPTLTLTFNENNQSEQDVILLSHAILSLLDRKKLLQTTLKNLKPNRNVIDSGSGSVISSAIQPNSFVLGQSIFILKIHKPGDVIGESIWIQPVITFNNEFVQKLGTYCYKSPKTLNSSFKAVRNVYVLLSGTHGNPSATQQNNLFATRALEVNEVGLEIVQSHLFSSFDDAVSNRLKWNIIFPLKNFKDPKYKAHVQNYQLELFGKLIKGNLEILTHLSSIPSLERVYVTFTLESAY